jgi:hypothetical protein
MHRRARISSKVICFKITIRSIALEKFSNEHSKCSNQASIRRTRQSPRMERTTMLVYAGEFARLHTCRRQYQVQRCCKYRHDLLLESLQSSNPRASTAAQIPNLKRLDLSGTPSLRSVSFSFTSSTKLHHANEV